MFGDPEPDVVGFQNDYVEKTIDVLNGYPNLMWELPNELYGTPWHQDLRDVIRSHEAGLPYQHLILCSHGGRAQDDIWTSRTPQATMELGDCFAPGHNWRDDASIGGNFRSNPALISAYADKPGIADMDHIWASLSPAERGGRQTRSPQAPTAARANSAKVLLLSSRGTVRMREMGTTTDGVDRYGGFVRMTERGLHLARLPLEGPSHGTRPLIGGLGNRPSGAKPGTSPFVVHRRRAGRVMPLPGCQLRCNAHWTRVALVLLGLSLTSVAAGCSRCRPAVEGELWDIDPAHRKTQQGWYTTGFLQRARGRHTATLLDDGTVLVVGGDACHEVLRSCERYHPAAATWGEATSLHHARESHSAIRLQDGRVLVVGGTRATTRAEIYDPTTNSWQLTGPMATPRAGAPAVLLSSGRVLVAGGRAGEYFHEPSKRVEIYDPGENRWHEAPALRNARAGHTLTLLADGRAWLAGGCDPEGGWVAGATAIYDPATDRWASATPLREPRCDHSATLLADGRVLVVGGHTAPSRNGIAGAGALATTELFDPTSDGPTELGPPMQAPRDGHLALRLPDARVLVQGGPHAIMDYGVAHQGVELFDPTANEWQREEMEARRGENTLTLLYDGAVLVAGGSTNAGPSGCCIYMDEAEIRLPR